MENLEKEFRIYVELLSLMENIENMVTPIDIQTGMFAIGKMNDLLQKVKDVSDKTQNIQFKEILTEIRNDLVDTKNLLIDSKEEIVQLKKENQALKEERDKPRKQKYTLDGLYYSDPYGAGGEGPYCTACYDLNEKFIKLTNGKVTELICPICATKYPKGLHNPFLSEDNDYESVKRKSQ